MEESTFTLWEKKAMSLGLVRLRMISMSVGSIGRRSRATMTLRAPAKKATPAKQETKSDDEFSLDDILNEFK